MKCKQCGAETMSLHSKGPHTGIYCNSCGAFQKWANKNELIVYSKCEIVPAPEYRPELDLDKIQNLDDVKKILSFLANSIFSTTTKDAIYTEFEVIKKYLK